VRAAGRRRPRRDADPKALGYARNQRAALRRFLDDGRLPLDNNISEQHLRREVLGRKNWLFLGSDEGARANTIFVTLLASCQLHGIEPWAYLRDLLCLLPSWPKSRVLELAPAFWQQTLQQQSRHSAAPGRQRLPRCLARRTRSDHVARRTYDDYPARPIAELPG
jgi:hypothetical protein